MRRLCIPSLVVLMLLSPLWGQAPNPQSNPQALTLATQALKAMTGGMLVQDATLIGTAVWLSGPNMESGTATLKSRGFWQSRLDLALSNGPRSEVRDSLTGAPAGTWSGADGVLHSMVQHNCWTDPNWFFPALSSLAAALSDSTVLLTYIGSETHNGLAVQHLHATRYFGNMDPHSLVVLQAVSAIDIYLDPSSFLPDAVDFTAHPDGDENTNLPVEIRFANYQAINGLVVPFRIQKLFNGALLLDVTVSSAQFNTNLPAIEF